MTRSNFLFISACVGIFVLACMATAFGMIRVIGWYLSNCGARSPSCSAASWLIDYWWLLFVPGVMLAAYFVYSYSQTRLERRRAGTL